MIEKELFVEIGVMDEGGATVWPSEFKILTHISDVAVIGELISLVQNQQEILTGIRTTINPVGTMGEDQ